MRRLFTPDDAPNEGVSPVVAVILMVAITVILSAVVGAFVFNLGQSTTDGQTEQSLGVRTTHADGQASVQVVTGEADELKILVNGSEANSITNPSPGDEVSVTASDDARITIISVSDGERRVISSPSSGDGSTTTNSVTAPTDGLISHWEFNDDSDYTVYDSVSTNDGSLSSGATYVTGVDGTAVDFNENNEAIVPDDSSLNFSASDSFTLAAWVNTENVSHSQTIIAKRPKNSQGYIFYLHKDKDSPGLKIGDGTDTVNYQFGPNVTDGTWHHVVVTVNRTDDNITFYVDGGAVGSDTTGAVDGLEAAQDPYIGAGSNNPYHMAGAIDDLRVYGRVLNESEVSDLHTATQP